MQTQNFRYFLTMYSKKNHYSKLRFFSKIMAIKQRLTELSLFVLHPSPSKFVIIAPNVTDEILKGQLTPIKNMPNHL